MAFSKPDDPEVQLQKSVDAARDACRWMETELAAAQKTAAEALNASRKAIRERKTSEALDHKQALADVRVTNLTAEQVGQSVEVNFTLPELTTDGQRLTKPLEVEVLRAAAPQGSGVAKLPEPEVWTHLIHDEWLPYSQGNNVSYSVHLTEREFHEWRGQTLVVGVRTLTRGFRHRSVESDASNLVDVPVYDVSEPVENLKLVSTEKALELQFSPPATTLGGAPIHDLAGFRIYRSLTGKPGSFELAADVPTPVYRDTKFEFGQTYYYQVRATFGKSGRLAMSDPTPVVKITPRDTFPPAPPEGLSSIYSAGAVELVWTANTEPDLAGYNVYRLEAPSPQRLNKELVRTPIFRDATAAPGKMLTYEVTAVDVSGNESKASIQETVETK